MSAEIAALKQLMLDSIAFCRQELKIPRFIDFFNIRAFQIENCFYLKTTIFQKVQS